MIIARLRIQFILAAAVGLLVAFLPTLPASAVTVPIPNSPEQGWSVNGSVRAVALGDGVAYLGGDFTEATGSNGTFPRRGLAVFKLDDGSVTDWRADTNETVRALALDGGSLYVGGDFTSIDGFDRNRLAQVSAASSDVNPDFDVRVNDNVWDLARDGSRLYVAGSYTKVGGVDRAYLAAVELADNKVVPDFDPVFNDRLRAVAISPDGQRVFAGGFFTSVNGVGRKYLATLNRNGEASSVDFGMAADHEIADLATDPTSTRLFAAVGGAGNQLAAFDGANGQRLWTVQADGDVQAVALNGGIVYFGFHQGFGGDLRLLLLAADAATGEVEAAFAPTVDSFYGVRALAATDRGLLAGGDFTLMNGVPAGRVAYFDPRRGSAVAPQPTTPPSTSPAKPPVPVRRSSVTLRAVKRDDALRTRISPRLGSKKQWRFVVQRKSNHGWKRVGRYLTKGQRHVRTVDLGKGSYRVKVLPRFGYKRSISRTVRLAR